MNSSTKKFLIFIAVFFILLILGDIFLWINITNQYNSPEALQAAYLEHYPSPIRNLQGLSILPLLLLVFASLVLIRSSKTNFIKTAAATLAAVLALVIIWKMFTLL